MTGTGPSARTVQLVRARDGGCARCGSTENLTTQHRVARGMGGSTAAWVNQPPNLLTLCGSGTTGCHGWVEAHPHLAQLEGWAVARFGPAPALVPVRYPDGLFLLRADGTRERCDGERGAGGRGGVGVGGWGAAGDGASVGGPGSAGEVRRRGW